MSSFSKKPARIPSHFTTTKGLIVVCLLAGVIHWISYRAFLTSVLSVNHVKLPFTTLEEMHQSGYRLTMTDGAFSRKFTNAKPGSMYHKLFRDLMDPSTSFYHYSNLKGALDNLLNNSGIVHMHIKHFVDSFENYRCKVYVRVHLLLLLRLLLAGFASDNH